MKISQYTGLNLQISNFLDYLSDGVVYADGKLNIIFLNSAGEKLLGWTRKELAGKPLDYLFPFSDLRLSNLPSELYFNTKSGRKICFSIKVPSDKLALADEPNFCLIFKPLEEDDKTGLKYKGLFEHALEGVLIADRTGTIVDVNPTACRIYQFTRDEFLSRSVRDLFPHKSDEEAFYIWNQFQKTGKINGFYKFQLPSGEYRYIEFRAKAGFIPGFNLAVFTDVTEKRKAENALRQSEAELKAIFNSSAQRIILLNLDYKVITLNVHALEASASNKSPISIGSSILEFFDNSKLSHDMAVSLLERAKKGERVHVESNIYTDKPNYWVEIYVSPVYNEQGKVSSICISTNDISVRKKAELALVESEARFKSLVQNSSDLVMVLNKQGRITYASPSAERIIGYTDEALPGKAFEDLVHQEDVQKVKEIFRKVISGTKVSSSVLEYRMLHPEGYLIFVETSYTNLVDDQYINGIVLNTRDVSERKFQEESLLLLERAIDSSDNGIIITDPNQPDNPIIYANKAFEMISGYSYLEMIGKNCRILQGGDTAQPELKKLRKALKAKKKVSVTLRNYRKDGALFWNELNISPVIREGKVTNFIGVLNDVTERKLAEEALLHITRGISGASSNEFLDVLATHLSATLQLDSVIFVERRGDTYLVRTNLTDGNLIEDERSPGDEVLNRIIKASGIVELNDLQNTFSSDRFIAKEKLHKVIALPLRTSSGYKSGMVLAFTRTKFHNAQLVKSLLNILSVRAAAELERDVYLQALQSSEQKFRGLAENSPDLVFIVDVIRHEIFYFNKRKFFGYSTKELTNEKAWKELHHPDDWEMSQRHWQSFIHRKSGSSIIEYRLKRKNGDYEWVMVRHAVLEEKDGKASRILVSFVEINERKQAENALRESEDRLRSLIENTDDIIWSVDNDLRLTTMNFPSRMLFRGKGRKTIKPGELLKDVLPQNISAQILDHHIQALNGDRVSGEFFIEGNNVNLFYEISFNPIYSDEGLVSGVSVFARNITERKKAENDIIRTNFELDSFVYRASHDLRAPLRSVLGLINLVKLEKQEKIRKNYLSLVEKSITKLDTFISDLTNFSRNSRLDIHNEKIDFLKIIDDCLENLRFMDKADNLSVEKRIVQNSPFYSDPTRIAIVIQNLISNCIKYQYIRSEKSFCRISIKAEKDHVKITIRDNGKGIRSEYMDKIFNMFFRASEDSYGSGLGLYITKQVVEKLKGSIQAESEIGKGTTFKIILPNAGIKR